MAQWSARFNPSIRRSMFRSVSKDFHLGTDREKQTKRGFVFALVKAFNRTCFDIWNQPCWNIKLFFRHWIMISVTRSGNLFDFGQLFIAFGNINLPKSLKLIGNFCKCVKIFHFSSEIILGNLIFFWSHWWWLALINCDKGYDASLSCQGPIQQVHFIRNLHILNIWH